MTSSIKSGHTVPVSPNVIPLRKQNGSPDGSRTVCPQNGTESSGSQNPDPRRSTSTSGTPSVTLSLAEIQIGAMVGIQRQIREIGKSDNRKNILDVYMRRHNDPSLSGLWGNSVEGALGELAVSKHLNRYHSGMTAHGGTDVGQNVEVRTRKNHEHQLFIKSTDKDLHFYVLVTGSFGEYILQGFIPSSYVFTRQDWFHDNNGRTARAFWVPNEELKPISELMELI